MPRASLLQVRAIQQRPEYGVEAMHILCLGLNHKTADVSLREKLAFPDEALKAALAREGCGGQALFSELVILSTCNRVELYAVAQRDEFAPLETFLSETRRVPQAEFQGHIYRLSDAHAVEHLLRVAAGLDSLVLGEPQILGQVTHALELSRAQEMAGPVLSRLFQAAIHAGKRVHTETAISRNPASISSVAANLAVEHISDLAGAQIVILGAGEMAELLVETLHKRGAANILVVNRTLERARQLASRWAAQATTFEYLVESVQKADILITSTGAPHTLVFPDMVQSALAERTGGRLVVIDIAVPRNVDVEVGEIDGVKLYDIDDLHRFLSESLNARERELPGAQAILKQEQEEFLDYLNGLHLLPLIKDLRQQAEEIRQAELKKTLRKLPELSEEDKKRIEALTEALVNKLLHEPVTRLRAEAQHPCGSEYALVTRSLFGLDNGYIDHEKENCHVSGNPCPFSAGLESQAY